MEDFSQQFDVHHDDGTLQNDPPSDPSAAFSQKNLKTIRTLSVSSPNITQLQLPEQLPNITQLYELDEHQLSRTQSKFFRRFKTVDKRERIIKSYSCALVGDILLQGRLYITKSHFAFYSNLFGHVTRILIHCSRVVELSKEKTARFIPNAVAVVVASGERRVFGSLLSRDTTYDTMLHVWRTAAVAGAVAGVVASGAGSTLSDNNNKSSSSGGGGGGGRLDDLDTSGVGGDVEEEEDEEDVVVGVDELVALTDVCGTVELDGQRTEPRQLCDGAFPAVYAVLSETSDDADASSNSGSASASSTPTPCNRHAANTHYTRCSKDGVSFSGVFPLIGLLITHIVTSAGHVIMRSRACHVRPPRLTLLLLLCNAALFILFVTSYRSLTTIESIRAQLDQQQLHQHKQQQQKPIQQHQSEFGYAASTPQPGYAYDSAADSPNRESASDVKSDTVHFDSVTSHDQSEKRCGARAEDSLCHTHRAKYLPYSDKLLTHSLYRLQMARRTLESLTMSSDIPASPCSSSHKYNHNTHTHNIPL